MFLREKCATNLITVAAPLAGTSTMDITVTTKATALAATMITAITVGTTITTTPSAITMAKDTNPIITTIMVPTIITTTETAIGVGTIATDIKP